jgi:predicted DNA-binding ribbon-helix-helix protein
VSSLAATNGEGQRFVMFGSRPSGNDSFNSIKRDTESRYDATRLHLLEGATMKSPIIKRSVIVSGHKTSISLEDPFWTCLKEIAQAQGASIAQTVTGIDETRQQTNLSSAIRLFVLGHARNGTNQSAV